MFSTATLTSAYTLSFAYNRHYYPALLYDTLAHLLYLFHRHDLQLSLLVLREEYSQSKFTYTGFRLLNPYFGYRLYLERDTKLNRYIVRFIDTPEGNQYTRLQPKRNALARTLNSDIHSLARMVRGIKANT